MSAFSPRQMFLLDHACQPIAEAFDATPYLVGTATGRGAYRDVDVRLILRNDRYDRLAEAVKPEALAFLGLAIGQYLESLTGMPIDFQVQRQSEANARHLGPRNPLGTRGLSDFVGDAAPHNACLEAADLAYAEHYPSADREEKR